MNRQKDGISLPERIQRTLGTLEHIQEHIEGINERLTAGEQRLDASEQRLTASDERFVRAEQRLDAAEQRMEVEDRRLDASEQRLTASDERFVRAEQRLDASEQRMEVEDRRLDALEQRLTASDERFVRAERRLDAAERHLGVIDQRLNELERNSRESRELLDFVLYDRGRFPRELAERFLGNRDAMISLNGGLSSVPTIWGDPERLHISPCASVYPCLFNTNSGEITVGDYTFAGSGVSILAGSHDYHLTGLPRRDAKLTEGCDVIIGKGVWLASGCTVLGPCKIGDHAVIAAGAVIVPGTDVPPGCVYGGIPAREIARINLTEELDPTDGAVLQALKRSGGILFTEGWGEKIADPECGRQGHLLLKPGGEILIDSACTRLQLWYHKDDDAEALLSVTGGGFDETIHLSSKTGRRDILLPGWEKPKTLIMTALTACQKLFVALEAQTEEKKA